MSSPSHLPLCSPEFLAQSMMGPNSMRILEELLQGLDLHPGMRVLDLGCGCGLTSIYLAKVFGVQVFATDLWISATENHARFCQMQVDDKVIPIHAEAHSLPFSEGYFDAVVSVDAYHYFGSNDTYFAQTLRPFLRPNALVALAVPGMKYELHDAVPEEMKPYWPLDALATWHSIPWWAERLQPHLTDWNAFELQCFDQAWAEWMATDNPHAVGDRPMIRTDGGRFMNLVGMTGRVK